MTEQPTTPDGAEGAQLPDQAPPVQALSDQPVPNPFAAPGGVVTPPPAAPSPAPGAPEGPVRHFDGQRWLVWDGTAWVPEVGATPPPASSGSNRTRVVAIVVVVVALLVGGTFVATRVMNANKAIVVPSTLGGLDKSTDPQVTQAADQFRNEASSALQDIKSDVGAYGSVSRGQVAFLIAARDDAPTSDFFTGLKSGVSDISSPTTVGNSKCVSSQSENISVCMRSGSRLTVGVFLTGPDTAKAASMVDEAWDQQ